MHSCGKVEAGLLCLLAFVDWSKLHTRWTDSSPRAACAVSFAQSRCGAGLVLDAP